MKFSSSALVLNLAIACGTPHCVRDFSRSASVQKLSINVPDEQAELVELARLTQSNADLLSIADQFQPDFTEWFDASNDDL